MLLLILKCLLYFTAIVASTNRPNHVKPLVDSSSADMIISELDITYQIFSAGENLGFHNKTCIKQAKFDRKHPSKFIVHGWRNSSHGHRLHKTLTLIRAAYEQKEKCNIVYVAWSNEFYQPFLLGVANSKILGDYIADFIIAAGFDLDKVHMIGYGLAAQVTGFAAKSVFKRTGNKILRITALDALGPKFEGASVDNRLEENDAQMVDAVHTDGYFHGYKPAFGRVDFFVNGGMEQPGCPPVKFDICSHLRAIWYFVESLKTNVTAYASESWDEYLKGNREENNTATFGENLDLKTKGTFYFETMGARPFLN